MCTMDYVSHVLGLQGWERVGGEVSMLVLNASEMTLGTFESMSI